MSILKVSGSPHLAWVATWPVWHIKSPTSPSNWWMVTFHGAGSGEEWICLRWLRISSPYFCLLFWGGVSTNKCKRIVRIVSKIGGLTRLQVKRTHTHTHVYTYIHTHTVTLHYAPLHFITFHSIAFIHPWKHIKPPPATNIMLSSASQVTLWELNCTSARWLSLAVSENKAICQTKTLANTC